MENADDTEVVREFQEAKTHKGRIILGNLKFQHGLIIRFVNTKFF